MKVRDLIATLKGMDQDADVHFSYDYGDYSHTDVAPEVEEVSTYHVVDSSYHSMPRIDTTGAEGSRLVVVLR
jgi:hypothetical protein